MKYLAPLSALIILAAGLFGTWFLYAEILRSAALIKDSRDQLAAIAARDAFQRTAAQFLADTTAERNAIQFFVTPADGTAQAIELVEAAAKLAGVKANVGSADLSSLNSHYERLTISVSAEGTYAGHARFATVLESLPRGATLESGTLGATERGWYGTYLISFIKLK